MRTHDLVGDRRAQKPDRRADPGIRRHQHPVEAELVGHADSMQWRRAAERDQGAAARILAALDCVHAGGVGHVFVDDLADPEGGERLAQVERRRDRLLHRLFGSVTIEGHAAAGKPEWVDTAKQEVGIGHGGRFAAAAITGRAGIGAGAVRTDGDALELVDPRDRAAAGADLDHLDDRYTQGQPTALLEAIDAGDLEGAAGLRLEAVDQANFGGGAPHIVGQHRLQPALPSDMASEDGTAGRPRLDEPHREPDRGLDGGQPAS